MNGPRRHALSILALAFAFAHSALAQSPPRLTGTLSVRAPRDARDRDVTVNVTLTNNTSAPAVLPGQVVTVPQLLLEVRGPQNQVMPTIPPPVPASSTVTIAPGQSVQRVLSLGMFSPPLRPGRYTVRFRSPLITGAVVSFTVAR